MDVHLTNDPANAQWQALADGEVAGVLVYELRGDAVALLHTVVEPAHEGQGIGGRLVRAAVDDARERRAHVLPYCSYVRAWLGRHPDEVDLVPADRRDEFGLPA